jgi:TonB-dependent receptor-like protein/carboxypeptidase family protein
MSRASHFSFRRISMWHSRRKPQKGLKIWSIAVAALFLASAGPTLAGIFGTVRGIVHDAQHHPIADATVVVEAKLSAWKKEAKSDSEGRFQIDAVPAGEYTVQITKAGFRDSTHDLTVVADAAPLLHFPLDLASVTERVEVSESTETVDRSSSALPLTVTRSMIQDTPGASRTNSLEFITAFTPGAYMVHDQLHVRGGHQVSWLVDGVPVPNTNIASNVGPQFDPKDIDVVEIQHGGESAEYGDRTYGTFNVIPRSGFERNREVELRATYGSYHSTDSQISFGDHTERFAYYASVSGNRTDVGLMPPIPEILHGNNNGTSGFTSLIFNVTPNDQLRLVASARADFFQVPTTEDAQTANVRNTQRERDAFANFSWVHTVSPGVLVTIAPFYHWNHSAFDGFGTDADQPVIPTDHLNSHYEGGLATVGVTKGRHNARFGLYGFAQQDDQFFAVVDPIGTIPALSEVARSNGGLFSAFAEEQLRATNWLTFNGGLRVTHFSGGVTEDHADPRIGAALRVPKLNWVFRGFYGRFYQAPPMQTVSGPLLAFVLDQGAEFLPLHGERDEQREFGLTIPVRGFTFDFSNFQTHARNFFDHDVLANSNIFFPLTIERARIHGWETTVRSPKLARSTELFLTYSNQSIQGAGTVTGGLLADTAQLCDGGGFCYLDHDQRNTLTTGFRSSLPWRLSASGTLGYGSGFLDGEGPNHLPGHTEFSLSLSKAFGESFRVSFTAENLSDSRYLIDNSNTFGGTHWNYPRQFTGEVRWRFHY